MDLPVTPGHIAEAALRIAPIARRTPIFTSRTFDALAGASVFFKCENLQTGGAFKIRGAANMIFSLTPDQLGKGVIAYSSGNHGQATAIAARHVGAACTLVMPLDSPRSKLDAARGYGAAVITYDRFRENREQIAAEVLERTGAVLVPPFDHPLIIAGQGTAARETLDEVPGLDAIITPVGGGGLLSGCATWAKGTNPGIRVFGAEPDGANDTYLSLQKGDRVTVEPQTIADGLRAPTPGVLTFSIVQKLVESVILVTDEEIRATMKFLLSRMKILVEPSGAVAAAAVLHRKLPADIRRVAIVLSGGNVDLETILS
ncbi:MAG: threonine/serine dehydratase [Bryobacteraceae bacterium]